MRPNPQPSRLGENRSKAMANWDDNTDILKNDDKVYNKFFQKTGTTNVTHKAIVVFGDPRREDFLKEITVKQHYFSYGDSLSKIAYKNYGDSRFWWVLAWFNSKPTDLHCEIGDKIFIPFPLEEAINQAQSGAEI